MTGTPGQQSNRQRADLPQGSARLLFW